MYIGHPSGCQGSSIQRQNGIKSLITGEYRKMHLSGPKQRDTGCSWHWDEKGVWVWPQWVNRDDCLIHCSSVQFSRSVVSDSLRPHGLQHTRPPCPSPTPGAYSNSCPLCRWCHPTISSSVVPFPSCLQSFPASGSFPMSQLFASGGQSAPAAAAKLLQSCPTLCDPMDSSPPGSSVPGILQARTLEWVAISFSNACMLSCFSRVQLCATLWTAAHQVPLSAGFSRQEHWSGLPFPSPQSAPKSAQTNTPH